MNELIASMSVPWWLVGMFWLFLGGLLFHMGFRAEVDSVLAHMMGMKPKKGKER